MGIIDWSILVLLLFFFVWGLRRGFAAMLVQLLGYIALFLLVGQYFPLVKQSLIDKFSFPSALASVVSFVLIAILIGITARLVIYILTRTLKLVHLSTINRVFGGIFGLLTALLIMMVIAVVLDYLPKISTPLKDKNLHVVYATIDELKDETFQTLKLQQHIKMLESRLEQGLKKKPTSK